MTMNHTSSMTARERFEAASDNLRIVEAQIKDKVTDKLGFIKILTESAAQVILEEKLLAKHRWSLEYQPWCDAISLVVHEVKLSDWDELHEIVKNEPMLTLDEGVVIDTIVENEISIRFNMDGGWREALPKFVEKFGIRLYTRSIEATIEGIEANARLFRSLLS